MFRMLRRTKTGTIVWILMARVLHGAFIIVKMMGPVKLNALCNLKQKLMIALVRFVSSYGTESLRKSNKS